MGEERNKTYIFPEKIGEPGKDANMEYFELDSEKELNIQPGKKWPQYLAALTATLGGMCAGTMLGWTSPALPYLQEPYNISNNSVQDISDDEASWIGSLTPLGASIGAVPAGYLAESVGRKAVLLLLCVPSVVGWLFIIFSQKKDNVRGAVGVYLELMLTLGILWVYVIGAFDQYLWLSISSCALPILFGASFAWMPESPVYLLSRGKNRDAKKSLHWLRGGDYFPQYDVQPELSGMQRLLNESAKIRNDNMNFKDMLLSLSWRSPIIKALRIIFGLMFFQQMSGINAVVFYTVEIFQKAGVSWSPQTATIAVGIVQVIATFFPSLIVETTGRRVLLLLSISSMTVCLGGLSLHAYIQENNLFADQDILGFIPVILVILHTIMFSIGFGPIPWFMMAELVPPEAKGWASSMSVCLNWALAFAVTNMFPHLIADLGPVGTYGLFAVISVIGTVFVFTSVPETKGKTREEIQLFESKYTNVIAKSAVKTNLMVFAVGTLLTWSSPASPMLQKDDSPFRITNEEATWVGSLLALGSVFGGPPFGWLVNRIGRKLTILALAVPITIGWVLILSTNSVTWLYVARFVSGLSLGGVSFVIPIYVAEVAEPSVRGPLSALTQVGFNVGILYSYAVGAMGNYTLLNLACLIVPIVFVLLFVWMPEAPQYQLSKNDPAGAAKSLQWLRGKQSNIDLAVLGLFFLLKEELEMDVSGISWIPLLSLLVYISAYCLGLGPLPWVVMSEVLPPNVKGIAGAIVASFCWITSFLITNSFQYAVDIVGRCGAFWFCGVMCLVSALFVFYKVPETKGISLQEIQEQLAGCKARSPTAETTTKIGAQINSNIVLHSVLVDTVLVELPFSHNYEQRPRKLARIPTFLNF
ncbi:hypothetical protein C0J52_03505 [Blattella germanica]|nr:hypothetical protein C0J52_03505 [Blattella germanica]